MKTQHLGPGSEFLNTRSLCEDGEIERIGHGAYRGTHAPKIQDFRWADLVEAVRLAKDGVVCLTSALAIYELTEEIPRQHWIAIRHETGHRAEPSTKVVRMRNIELGKTTTKLGNVTIPIFDREISRPVRWQHPW